MLSELGFDLLDVTNKLEGHLKENSLTERICSRFEELQKDNVTIVDYLPEYGPYFRTLNEEWFAALLLH